MVNYYMNFFFSLKDTTPRFPLPGVLAGWRSDLQGKERSDSKNLDRDIFVQTNYGQIQGFKTYLYDTPESRHRPWSQTVERVTRDVNVFLGIPYAMPPTGEGRFKPPRPHQCVFSKKHIWVVKKGVKLKISRFYRKNQNFEKE